MNAIKDCVFLINFFDLAMFIHWTAARSPFTISNKVHAAFVVLNFDCGGNLYFKNFCSMIRAPTCRFYQTGDCLNGELCPFAHPTQRCRNFTADGWCPYGVHCHYWHDQKNTALATRDCRPVQKICRFFLNGQCNYGDSCSYSHQLIDSGNPALTVAEYKMMRTRISSLNSLALSSRPVCPASASPAAGLARPPVPRPTARLEQAYIDALQPGDLEKMRDLEVDRLLKRFPPSQLKTVSGNSEDARVFALIFSSTDPDWAHEVKRIIISISLPVDYPRTPPILKVPRTSDLPYLLTKNVNKVIAEWVADRQEAYASTNRVALFLRPFLFWLDKELNQLFTEGYRLTAQYPDGSQTPLEETLFPTPQDFDTKEENTAPSSTDYQDDVAAPLSPYRNLPSGSAPNADPDDSSDSTPDSGDAVVSASASQQQLNFESLEMRGQAGTCLFIRLPVVCSCVRCRYTFQWVFRLPHPQQPQQSTSFNSIPPHTSTCPRCRQAMGLMFEASLVHSFTGLIGTFGMANCIISDVMVKAAEAVVHCINCNSDFNTTGLVPERVNAKRCPKCYSACGLFFTDVTISRQQKASEIINKRFAILSSSQTPKSRQRKNADVADQPFVIQKGTPLPLNGACRHYKKSFRWLRFPCCNRAFPCDACHDKEVAGTHETLYANRTICGFCSKEQPCNGGAQQQVCVACNQHLTGSRTTHWEGGKGCRDQTKMSRKDKRKYRNKT